jgi:endonuclease/exonuclease/phosphatase family metal-dependent hydrolase
MLCAACAPAPLAVEDTSASLSVPGQGAPDTLDVGSWNIEWFGATGMGPSDEKLQLDNARAVIAGTNMDVWGLAEIVSQSQFEKLEAALPGYAGLTVSDPQVVGGASSYSASEQKLAILYRTSVATLLSARVILSASDDVFAGRPPLEARLRVTLSGTSEEVVLIVLHAKAMDDDQSYQKRAKASAALKTYLNGTYPSQKVIVVGDFNDDVDKSITAGKASPYANFVGDSARYRFPSAELSLAGVATTTGYPDAIDHHLTSNELYARYVASSVEAYRVDEYIGNYANSTSDHFPVLSRYRFGAGGGGDGDGDGDGDEQPEPEPGVPELVINEVRANEPGSDTRAEFIELLNVGGASANLAGVTLSDAVGVRHKFAPASLAPGKAVVVFGGKGAIPLGLGNALAASSGGLGLNNTTDTVKLKDASGRTLDALSYAKALAAKDGVSMNLARDGDPGEDFVLHTSMSPLAASPGKRIDGSPF